MIEEQMAKEIKKLKKRIAELETRGHKHPLINLGTPTELTIDDGVITRTKSYHMVDTAADASSDDLDEVKGGVSGDLLILRAANSARTVVCKDGVTNLLLAGDFSLDHADDTIMLLFDGTNWLEISRSDNTA